MTQKYDGGPAFPACDEANFNGTVGITMRDYFAAKAMQGLLANPSGPIQENGMSGWGWCNCTPEDVIDLAYTLADAAMEHVS